MPGATVTRGSVATHPHGRLPDARGRSRLTGHRWCGRTAARGAAGAGPGSAPGTCACLPLFPLASAATAATAVFAPFSGFPARYPAIRAAPACRPADERRAPEARRRGAAAQRGRDRRPEDGGLVGLDGGVVYQSVRASSRCGPVAARASRSACAKGITSSLRLWTSNSGRPSSCTRASLSQDSAAAVPARVARCRSPRPRRAPN